ncbi:hypothetical protein CEXT_392271 [Caerostris extrusa]|uniref:Uncharacterized protein n=1 Tax=Caerostris extrusa TaxID=172846 RepID=A0AAV4Y4G7_CAEEX|nr:hypothetical protein CEXT_392271 [Caerostris extrusa]
MSNGWFNRESNMYHLGTMWTPRLLERSPELSKHPPKLLPRKQAPTKRAYSARKFSFASVLNIQTPSQLLLPSSRPAP